MVEVQGARYLALIGLADERLATMPVAVESDRLIAFAQRRGFPLEMEERSSISAGVFVVNALYHLLANFSGRDTLRLPRR